MTDGFILSKVCPFAATDQQELIASPSSDTPVLEDTESSIVDAFTSGCCYVNEGVLENQDSSHFISATLKNKSVESVPHPGKEASRIVWFVGPTIFVAFFVLLSLYLHKVFSAMFENSLLTGTLSVMVECFSHLRSWCFNNANIIF